MKSFVSVNNNQQGQQPQTLHSGSFINNENARPYPSPQNVVMGHSGLAGHSAHGQVVSEKDKIMNDIFKKIHDSKLNLH